MWKKCIICKRKFECYDKSKGRKGIRTRGKIKRKSNCVTCSHECAREYSRNPQNYKNDCVNYHTKKATLA